MKKALIVGINHYEKINNLNGCVNDAYSVKNILERNSDGSVNFSVKLLASNGEEDIITRKYLKGHIEDLFQDDSECALFYFAGHGYVESTGGFLVTGECEDGDDGISLSEILHFANTSRARNKIIILDSCHAGIAGSREPGGASEINDGVTILAASTEDQYADEVSDSGIFTSLLVDAMAGSAGNLVGEVTAGSIYAHIDQSLGPWEQRPVFKTNVKSFFSLRKVSAPIQLNDLQRIVEFFPEPGDQYQLDSSYEPDSKNPNSENNEKFATLQRMNRVNLVVPVGATHMYFAAMEGKSCKLTVLGEHYRRLVASGRI